MAKLPTLDFSNLSGVSLIQKYLSQFSSNVLSLVNGRLTFGDNLLSKTVISNFTLSATNTTINHGLGVVPTGYLVARISAAAKIYDGNPLTAGPTFINLRCDTAGVTSTLVFF